VLQFMRLTLGLVLRAPIAPRVSAAHMSGLKISSNTEVTDSLRDHAMAKLGVPLEKFASILNDAKEVDLHMTVEKRGNHDEQHQGRQAHMAEVTAHLKGKHKSITVGSESEDMYATIDELEGLLARALRKAKEKKVDMKEKRGSKGKTDLDASATFDEDGGAAEPAPMKVAAATGAAEKGASETMGAPPSGFDWAPGIY